MAKKRFAILMLLEVMRCTAPPPCQDLPKELNGPGKTKLHISSIEAFGEPQAWDLTIKANTLVGYELIKWDEPDSFESRAFTVSFDGGSIIRYATANHSATVGLCLPGMIFVLKPGDSYEYPKHDGTVGVAVLDTTQFSVAMAHEFGHAMGLIHTDHGLMTPDVNNACRGKEVECLIDALKDQGKM